MTLVIFLIYVPLVSMNNDFICDRNEFPYQGEKLGYCLGPVANFSNKMAQWILKDTTKITSSHAVRSLTEDEY